MLRQASTRPAAPVVPAPVQPAPGVASLPPAALAPITVQDLNALKARRNELSNQLTSALDRRHDVQRDLRNASTPADRLGLESRLAVLDKRIAQLESDMAETGRLLTTAPSALLASAGASSSRGGLSSGQITAMGIISIVFIWAPLAVAFSRLMWRRSTRRDAAALQPSPDVVHRLERMEQGIEVIALEVERISEGQRFVAQLMSDSTKRVAEAARLVNTPS